MDTSRAEIGSSQIMHSGSTANARAMPATEISGHNSTPRRTTSTASSGEITCAVTPGRSSFSFRLRTQKLQDMLQTGHTGRWILPLFLAAPKHGCRAKTCSLVAIVSLYCIHLECIKKQINRVFSNQSRLYHPALSPSNLFYNYIFP